MRLATKFLLVLLTALCFVSLATLKVSDAHRGIGHGFPLLGLSEDINTTRQAHGMEPMRLNRRLTVEADHYAHQLCTTEVLVHAEDIRGDDRFWIYGENIGWALDWRILEEKFAESPGHLRNILDERFTDYGVGVCKRGDRWWVVYRFGGNLSLTLD